jgi:chromosome transmission fidelity protein 1
MDKKRQKRVEIYEKKKKKFLVETFSNKFESIETKKEQNKEIIKDKEEEEDKNILLVDYDEKINIKASILDGLYSSDEENENKIENEDNYFNPKVRVFEINKIIFCSRTHTQISQFIQELKKTKFFKNIKLVSLGSRNKLCINPKINKTKNLNKLNERKLFFSLITKIVCLELKKSKFLP